MHPASKEILDILNEYMSSNYGTYWNAEMRQALEFLFEAGFVFQFDYDEAGHTCTEDWTIMTDRNKLEEFRKREIQRFLASRAKV